MLRAIASDIASAFNFLPEPPKRVSVEDNIEDCRGSRPAGKALTLLQFLLSALLICGVVLITFEEIMEFPAKRKLESKNTGDHTPDGDPPSPLTVQGLFERFDAGLISVLSCPCNSPTLRLGDILKPLSSNSKQIDFAFDPIASLGLTNSEDGVKAFLDESFSDMDDCLASIDAVKLKAELGSALTKANLPTSSPQSLEKLASTSPSSSGLASFAKSVCEFAFGIDKALQGSAVYPKQKWAARVCTDSSRPNGISLLPWRLAGYATAVDGAYNFAYMQAQRKSKFGLEMSGVISSLRQFANEFRDDLVPNASFVTQIAVSKAELSRLVNDTIKQQRVLAGARGDVLVPGAISGESTLFETDCKFAATPHPFGFSS